LSGVAGKVLRGAGKTALVVLAAFALLVGVTWMFLQTRRGGEAILVGVPRMEIMLELPAFFGVVLMSKTIKGCWYGSSNVQQDVPKLLEYYQRGELKLDELISRRIKVDEVNDAFSAMEAGEVARSVIQY